MPIFHIKLLHLLHRWWISWPFNSPQQPTNSLTQHKKSALLKDYSLFLLNETFVYTYFWHLKQKLSHASFSLMLWFTWLLSWKFSLRDSTSELKTDKPLTSVLATEDFIWTVEHKGEFLKSWERLSMSIDFLPLCLLLRPFLQSLVTSEGIFL